MVVNLSSGAQCSRILRLPARRCARLRATTPRLGVHLQNSYSTECPAGQKIIFSGIQPTGVPHLGNYLGALHEWVQLQNNASEGTKLLFSIVDLHALTVPQEPRILRKMRKEMFATLLAVGLDPAKATIFYQSDVGDDCKPLLVQLKPSY